MIGKLDPEHLALVVSRTGASDEAVSVGPGYGEDAAAIEVGERTLVVSSDPLSLARERLGTLAVNVASNDVACSGADPRWLTNVVFLPDDDRETLDVVTRQIDEAATELDIAIVGGHSEYAPDLSRPMVTMTCMGLADEFVPTGGAEPGDRLILTKGAGIEGTAILATDFRAEVGPAAERGESFFEEISVAEDARHLREYAHAMHDPTEGGVVTGLLEMAEASGVRLEVARDDVPVRDATRDLCDTMGVDPLRIFGSGALLAAVPEGSVEEALDAVRGAGIPAAVVGRVVEGDGALALDDAEVTDPPRDELYALWE
ncbi:AIR synthase related protein domain protein [Haladaptatus paucihalophilus DX253]|uniref:AIR synthase related protein domain protein n=1 Tax=Haladaptatus paucihalophilus DX253 TaxID=797209 RepID=E7QY07_HALPU|nr:AIR synthase family protein [Haladaptatus paucihalophilus]EFW90473.1 AIR synthase related protein domain protein [Haladaptatus paucihalophilus DX253]SHK79155.1 hydrogenase expression/formation protein HypE [Haladaptatus paucihalophilus DX253]